MSWSSKQYLKFETERNRPILDLLNNIPHSNPRTIADIGCGPGNSTGLLIAKYPQATITGIDSSEDMIEAARKRLPELSFEVVDISTWGNPGPFDIILANAALQWVPDHQSLFPFLINKLAKNGTLAVQMPDNLDEPTHVMMRKTASEGEWADKIAVNNNRVGRQTADWYYNLLHSPELKLDIWRTTYYHLLPGGVQDIVEWFKGSGLRPFLDPLSESEKPEFLSAYLKNITASYPELKDGSALLPFPRLFIVATKI